MAIVSSSGFFCEMKISYFTAQLSEVMGDLELIQAKVPILKFRDKKNNLEVDLNCNNAVGIRNTHLLHCYSQSMFVVDSKFIF